MSTPMGLIYDMYEYAYTKLYARAHFELHAHAYHHAYVVVQSNAFYSHRSANRFANKYWVSYADAITTDLTTSGSEPTHDYAIDSASIKSQRL